MTLQWNKSVKMRFYYKHTISSPVFNDFIIKIDNIVLTFLNVINSINLVVLLVMAYFNSEN